jgi:hypothetical protein
MSQENAIQISSARANELFQGKAGDTITRMMVENSQLQAVIEAVNQELQTTRQTLEAVREELRLTKAKLDRMVATGNEAPDPRPPLPQDTSTP